MSKLYRKPDMEVDGHYNLQAGRGNERCNTFEDVVAEEHAFQLVGSANSHLTSARSVTAKKHSRQLLGDVSDTTIQQIIRYHNGLLLKEEYFPHGQQSRNSQGSAAL
jgi:hypothetical protein